MSSRADRRKFVQALAREGLSLEEITRRYDAKFGTHYSKRTEWAGRLVKGWEALQDW